MSKYNLTDIFEEMSTAEKERFDRLSKDDQDKLKKVMGIMAKEKSMKEVTSSEISRMEGLVDQRMKAKLLDIFGDCLLYTSPSPRDRTRSRMPSSA